MGVRPLVPLSLHCLSPSPLPATCFSLSPLLLPPILLPSPRCVFVDAGVSAIDVETRRRKAQRKRSEAEAKVVREKGELALLAMPAENKEEPAEKVQLRPPMLQVSTSSNQVAVREFK